MSLNYYNHEVYIVPSTIMKTIDKISISVNNLKLYNKALFNVNVLDSLDNILYSKIVELTESEYLLWKNDDNFVKTLILDRLVLQEDISKPSSYSVDNSYIVNVIPKQISYNITKLKICFCSLTLFQGAVFKLQLYDSDCCFYSEDILSLTQEQYLQWLNDDSFIKNLALQKLGLVEQL